MTDIQKIAEDVINALTPDTIYQGIYSKTVSLDRYYIIKKLWSETLGGLPLSNEQVRKMIAEYELTKRVANAIDGFDPDKHVSPYEFDTREKS